MEEGMTLLLAALIGFGHAFEADHLLAVSTLTAKSQSTRQVATNGFLWGLGHTSTIVVIGLLLIGFNMQGLKSYFDYFELFVGVMLILLGAVRIFQEKKQSASAASGHSHPHTHDGEAYGIGLVHGLAGSGALILLVLADLSDPFLAMIYLLLFGLGSAIGMSFAASVLRLPMLLGRHRDLSRRLFTWASALLCIGYGVHILVRFV